jgi:hypothetical protein
MKENQLQKQAKKLYKGLHENVRLYKIKIKDHLCCIVVRVSGYRSRGPGFDYRPYQIF